MTRTLSVRLLVRGDPVAMSRHLAGDPQSWLPAPARPRGVDRWTVDLAAGRVHRRVACGIGLPWVVGRALSRAVTWEPVAEPDELIGAASALPTLRGKVWLLPEAGEAAIELEGSYRPPAGLLGATVDRAVLHRVAEATGTWFVREIAVGLSRSTAEAQSAPIGDEQRVSQLHFGGRPP